DDILIGAYRDEEGIGVEFTGQVYLLLSTLSSEFDISLVSISNNQNNLFAKIQVNGNLDYSDQNKYYRLFISKNDSFGNSTTPDTGENLPFNYNYMIESFNATLWRIYNSTDVNIANATASNNNNTIEVSISLFELSLSTDDNINVTFETGSNTERYDLALDYPSFVSYTIKDANPQMGSVETFDQNLDSKSTFEPNEDIRIRINVTETKADVDVVRITIVNASGGTMINLTAMTNISSITNGAVYEYNYSISNAYDLGSWSITVNANNTEGDSNTKGGSFTVINYNPIVIDVNVVPQKVANGTTLNISANITDPGGVSAAFVNIYFPNGAFWTNITLLNSSNPDIWFNDSIIVPSSGSWGNYTFTIWAKDSYNAVNNTEGSSFVVYVDFNEKATDIIIDGNFNEWSSGNISDIVQDASTALESGTQNFKLRSNNGPVKIENASSGGHIIQTSTGILYAFILDPSVCEIWKSTDEGNTWSQQDSSNSPTTSTSCTIAIDSNDTLHL
ncbi:MAG: hypothetical protein KAJ19_24370, partial [Gammaproteobacteria bacterium]|nr:hypothetical protein [Gammaproteobacteria bacterium]